MIITIFTSEAYIKKYTPVGELVDWAQLSPTVNIVQETYIQDILGTNFYDYIQTKYLNQTLNSSETDLVNLIKPAQAYRVAEQALPFINYQINSKGLMSQSGDYSQSTDLTGVKYLRGVLYSRADFFAKRLSNFLCENSALFPEYIADNSTDMSPHSSKYDGGLYLG